MKPVRSAKALVPEGEFSKLFAPWLSISRTKVCVAEDVRSAERNTSWVKACSVSSVLAVTASSPESAASTRP